MSDAYYTATRDAGLIGDGDPASVEISNAAITKLAYDASAEGNKPLEIMSMTEPGAARTRVMAERTI